MSVNVCVFVNLTPLLPLSVNLCVFVNLTPTQLDALAVDVLTILLVRNLDQNLLVRQVNPHLRVLNLTPIVSFVNLTQRATQRDALAVEHAAPPPLTCQLLGARELNPNLSPVCQLLLVGQLNPHPSPVCQS